MLGPAVANDGSAGRGSDGVGAAFQEVFHVHLHVFPRFAGGGFRIDANWRVRERDELDAGAAAVRAGLAELTATQR
ncbi:HIT family protein [Streptomyces sp. NPDC055080]